MKQRFLLCIIVSSAHIVFTMENNNNSLINFNNIYQTLYDKLDPATIITELHKIGVSKDPREQMTQMHRLDRVIPYYIGNDDTASLCSTLDQVFANNWPLSDLAQQMAIKYLQEKYPIIQNKPLPNYVITTLEVMNTTVIKELLETGVSKDPHEQMTQMHRLDRVIPYYIDNKQTPKLCETLNLVIDKQWPLSDIARTTAISYLCDIRPSLENDNKPLLKNVNLTLDLMNPAQIIYDLQKNQPYSKELIEIENRVNTALGKLIKLQDTKNLGLFINILTKNQKISIIPGERVLKEVYKCLRTEEKKNKSDKDSFVQKFKVTKNDSDTEDKPKLEQK